MATSALSKYTYLFSRFDLRLSDSSLDRSDYLLMLEDDKGNVFRYRK